MDKSGYKQRHRVKEVPRLPLEGILDLTYRCNLNCRHCWLRIPPRANERQRELSFDEIKHIVDEARKLGCQKWSLSGGEPMLRPDFAEIFAYITAKSVYYHLNTNGTLITPEIARLLTRKGYKKVALYGATAEVHDRITRHPGSFEAVMQGFAYLREARAGFVVSLTPMRDNYHQFPEIVQLALSLSPQYILGAPWLFLSACGSSRRNAEIVRQRPDPKEVIKIDQPNPSFEGWGALEAEASCGGGGADDRLYARCIRNRRKFSIDPYGFMSFCEQITDLALLYDLRRGTFQEAWEDFIPSLADRVRGGPEYLENCGSCSLLQDCRWCGVFGYLEHGRHSAKIEYLCQVARENRAFKEDWKRQHRRYYDIAGITVQVEAQLPINDQTFVPKFREFEVDSPGPDLVSISHHFHFPDLKDQNLGQEVYRRSPWAVHRKGSAWIYLGISSIPDDPTYRFVAVFNHNYTRGRMHHNDEDLFRAGGLTSLTALPTDQFFLAQVLADRQGGILHSSAAILEGQGLIFVGHSEAGKSTTMKMLQGKAKILCDDRNIVRRWPEGFRVHGTWSHGEVPLVSPASAPLKAILFLKQSQQNRLVRLKPGREIVEKLSACLIKPLTTADWWQKMLTLMVTMAREIPCYEMHFDRSGKVIPLLEDLARQPLIKAGGGAQ
jgi:MoaA/NifB/PqqE/SkfB family radical SAM enzyme